MMVKGGIWRGECLLHHFVNTVEEKLNRYELSASARSIASLSDLQITKTIPIVKPPHLIATEYKDLHVPSISDNHLYRK